MSRLILFGALGLPLLVLGGAALLWALQRDLPKPPNDKLPPPPVKPEERGNSEQLKLQRQIKELETKKAAIKAVLQDLDEEKQEVLANLRKSGVASVADLRGNASGQKYAARLQQISQEMEVMRAKQEEFAQAFEQGQAVLRQLNRQLILEKAGITDEELTKVTVTIAQIDEKLQGGPSKQPANPLQLEAVLQKELKSQEQVEIDRVIARANEAIQAQPANPAPHLQRGNAYFDKGEFAKALADYDEAIRLDASYAQAYHNRGMAQAIQGAYDAAITDYDEAIRLEPAHAEARHNRGLAYAQKKDFAKALADLGEALRLEPKNALAYSDRGFIYLGEKNYDGAVADYSKAIELEPKKAMGYIRRGDAYRLKGENGKAVQDYSSALGIDGRLIHVRQLRGNSYRTLGEYDKALADFREVVKAEPKNAVAHNDLAWFWATCKDEKYRDGKQALAHAKKANELTGGKDAGVLDTLAAAHAEAGEFEEAVECLEKALGLAQETQKKEFEERLKLYQEKKAYREK